MAFLSFSSVKSEHGELSDGEDVEEFILDLVEEYDVVVFAKSYCPHCRKTRELLEKIHEHEEFDEEMEMKILDLDLLNGEDGSMIQAVLAELTDQRTVPNVFIGGEHVGGNAELQQMHAEGSLISLLESVISGAEEDDEEDDEEEEF